MSSSTPSGARPLSLDSSIPDAPEWKDDQDHIMRVTRRHQEHRMRMVEKALIQRRISVDKKGFGSDSWERDVSPPPERVNRLLSLPMPSLAVQHKHAWNPNDRSLNIFILNNNPLTLHRHPVAQSTDAIRSRCAYQTGLHAFAINWPRAQRGTHAIVGVATTEAPLHAVGYQGLVGATQESWGWDLGRLLLQHDGVTCGPYPVPKQNAAGNTTADEVSKEIDVPDEFILILDMDEGTLSFAVYTDFTPSEGQQKKWKYLGVAFYGLKTKIPKICLHVYLSAVWGHCEISMRYLGSIRQPRSLMDLSRLVVCDCLYISFVMNQLNEEASARNVNILRRRPQCPVVRYRSLQEMVKTLVIPVTLKDFVLYGRN